MTFYRKFMFRFNNSQINFTLNIILNFLWMKPNFTIGNKFLRSRVKGLGDTTGNPFWSRCLFGLAILVLRQIGEMNVLKFDNFVVQIGALQSHQTFDLAHAVFLIWFVISLCEEHDKLMHSKTKKPDISIFVWNKTNFVGFIHSWSDDDFEMEELSRNFDSLFYFIPRSYCSVFFVAVEHFFVSLQILAKDLL